MKKKPLSAKAKARIAICKDVIKQVNSETYDCRSGGYYFSGTLTCKVNVDSSLKRHMKKISECSVCALGGVLYSYINRYNNVAVKELGDEVDEVMDSYGYTHKQNAIEFDAERTDVIRILSRVFSRDQLNLIEAVFENVVFGARIRIKDFNPDYYVDPDDSYEKDVRLINIMENIIANGGTLKKNPELMKKAKEAVCVGPRIGWQ